MGEKIKEKVGKVDEERIAFPEIASGEVPRLFSNIHYDRPSSKEENNNNNSKTKIIHNPGSVIGASFLIAGTTIGAGVLGIPTATVPIGFLPSVGGLIFAWFYMVISGLLIAELCINRIGETGRPGIGILDLYKNVLGDVLGGVLGTSAYFFLHYSVLVGYIA